MPVEKVPGGYRWGKTGKVYKRRIDAVKQGEAIQAKKSSTGHNKGGTVSKNPKQQAAIAIAKKKKAAGMSKGGDTINAAGNYTKPTMRRKLVEKYKAGSKGGKPGQWSARKAQMVAKEYKAKGGGYKS